MVKFSLKQTSARVSLLRVEIENETSQENFCESGMRMRVLGEKLKVGNESSEGEMRLKLKMRLPIFKNGGLIKTVLYDYHIKIYN